MNEKYGVGGGMRPNVDRRLRRNAHLMAVSTLGVSQMIGVHDPKVWDSQEKWVRFPPHAFFIRRFEMKTIYKYEIPVEEKFSIPIPQGCRILKVGMQHGRVYLWALVETDREMVERKFAIKGTGQEINDDEFLEYIGTFFQLQGTFVWHLFERF